MAPLNPEALLPSERRVLRKNANAVIDVREARLSRFPLDNLMWSVGMRGKEAIGGRLHLTNHRLVFRSHRINRARGTFSVFLPCIEEIRKMSFAVTRQVTVSTAMQGFTFVIWGVPRLIDTIDRYRAGFADTHLPELAGLVLAEPWKVGDGLQRSARHEPPGAVLDSAHALTGPAPEYQRLVWACRSRRHPKGAATLTSPRSRACLPDLAGRPFTADGPAQGPNEASTAFTLQSEHVPDFLARNRCR
ncbi:hypothetical protein AB0O86_19620 [Streptomyces hirsutus]|uniref:hypothetical protein n=1 Tax=Streptomyces hirsutus TaxID=35620 RepID=UPI0034387517